VQYCADEQETRIMIEAREVQIEIRQVAKIYGDHNVRALQSIDLNIGRGEFLALTGASGCGKSTLLNIIAGIDRQTSGSVLLDGDDLTKLDDNALTAIRAKKIGFIFQFFNLLSTMTVAENISLPLELSSHLSKTESRQKVESMLERMQLKARAQFYPAQLSGGEMQRTAIARALVHSPELILADEPTGNLDTENGCIVLDLLKKINEEDGLTIVMATHSVVAASYAHRIILLKDGHMVGETAQCPAI
jgi:putative ABC transport system ATP-binding protein